jgi:hypothetical protein
MSEFKLDPMFADAEALYWAFQRRRADDPHLNFGMVPSRELIDIFEPHPRRTRQQWLEAMLWNALRPGSARSPISTRPFRSTSRRCRQSGR